MFEVGDIGLSTSTSWLSKLIIWAESGHTGNATKSHAFIMVDVDLLVEPLASGKICVNNIEKYAKETFDIRRLPLDDEDREALRVNVIREVNRAYGFTKLPLFLLDSAITKISSLFGRKEPIFFFTKYFGLSSFVVCSQFVVWAIHKFTKFRFRDKNGKIIDWKIASPDYLEDLLKLPINQATLVYSQKGIK